MTSRISSLKNILNRKQFKCFVAMAFEHSDTDIIYSRFIAPVLLKNNVIPIIINRQEDNRDINLQIIDQLDQCDFCIADLTYTRPSVYYEAGYAQKFVEVIYTVRADHLKKNQPEDQRVHFDLQMKPIIKWENQNDEDFPKKLEKRLIKTVLHDLKMKQDVETKIISEQNEFNSLSVKDRLNIIRKSALEIALKNNFKVWSMLSANYYDSFINKNVNITNPLDYSEYSCFFISHKFKEQSLSIVSFVALPKILISFIRNNLNHLFRSIDSSYISINKVPDNILKIEEHHVTLSINKPPIKRILCEMQHLTKDKHYDRYYYEGRLNVTKGIGIKKNIYLYFPNELNTISRINVEIEKFFSIIG